CVDVFEAEEDAGVDGWLALGRLPGLARLQVDDPLEPGLVPPGVEVTTFSDELGLPERRPVADWFDAFEA
ncbi:MAG: hypothetical protein ABMB14_40995, partial [Myxococcota bacterium]